MKKFLVLSMLLMSAVVFVPSAEAKSSNNNTLTANNSAVPQIQVQIGGQNRRNNRYNRYNRRARVVNSVRNVRVGRRIYRETYQTRYQPNGRVTTRLISRVFIGRY
ncbi:MAG: hypothetical protein M3521_08105 [Acidobacteriota bacterium]|jgi:hypothetical protein|nr:hypothetical protein [Acidobacteriota bacterium]